MNNLSGIRLQGFSTTLILLAMLLVLAVIAGFYLFQNDSSVAYNKIEPQSNKGTSPSPSPILFEELTIPFLRSRTYQSKLGDLREYSNNGSFKTYLTGYDSDGLKINGLLTEPVGKRPEGGWPAIVFIHGYIPPTTYRTTEKYMDYVNYLARNGFVVFKIDLRGHGDSEGEPSGAYYSSDYVIDSLNAYSALQNSGFVNPNKIGLWGHSMAGNIVLRALTVKPEIPAVSIWGGAVYTYLDMAELGIQDGSYRPPANQEERQKKRQLLRETYGDPDDGNDFWKLVAPTNYLDSVLGAIQLNHAANDEVVSVEYSRGLENILKDMNIPHELNEYPSGGHNITNPSFTPAMQKTVDFFNKYLKASES